MKLLWYMYMEQKDIQKNQEADEVRNLELMIERDRRSINNHIETNRFEIQKTNFFITFLILTITFSGLESIAVYQRIVVLVLVLLILWLATYNFYWRTIYGWDINWRDWLWKKDKVTSLKLIRELENQLKNEYQKLSLLRARMNKYILLLLFLILILLFMEKSNLKIVDTQSLQKNDVHVSQPLNELPKDTTVSGDNSNPTPQATQTNGLDYSYIVTR